MPGRCICPRDRAARGYDRRRRRRCRRGSSAFLRSGISKLRHPSAAAALAEAVCRSESRTRTKKVYDGSLARDADGPAAVSPSTDPSRTHTISDLGSGALLTTASPNAPTPASTADLPLTDAHAEHVE